jgi:hypothetical protein
MVHVVLVYILAGIFVLAALSILGIFMERREKRRFEPKRLDDETNGDFLNS